MKKRIIGMLLSATLVIGMCASPVNAYAANTTKKATTGSVSKNASVGTRVNANAVQDSISGAVIVGDDVLYTAHFKTAPSSDDGLLYVFELKTYQYGLTDDMMPIASVETGLDISLKFPLNYTQGYSRLYNKFVLAAKKNGSWVLVNNAQYINNPEAIGTHTRARVERPKKALQEGNVANIFMDGVVTPGESNVGALHGVFSVNSNEVITADPACQNKDLHPIKGNPIAGYMINANDDAGIEALIAEMVNYAANSKIQDFVIGNEVNERCWNYSAWTDWDTYVRKYVQAFRVCYTAIKATNPNAMVYISIDQVWNKNAKSFEYLDGDEFLEKFNNMIKENGNIDWNVSIHPYPNPLYYAKFWDLSGVANGSVFKSQVEKNQVITFQNLSVLTDTLCMDAYRDRIGQVRDVIIGEIGMGTNAGGESQAAGVCASYAAFELNPYVTQYMYLEVDINGFFPTLKGKGLEAFNAMGTIDEPTYMQWALDYIGIKDWSEVLR